MFRSLLELLHQVNIWYLYISKQVQGLANLGDCNGKGFSEEVSQNTYGLSVSCLSHEDRPGINQDNVHEHSAGRPIVDQDSDNSDSEIFRVKRRSFFKVEKRNGNDTMSSKKSEHQVWYSIPKLISYVCYKIVNLTFSGAFSKKKTIY